MEFLYKILFFIIHFSVFLLITLKDYIFNAYWHLKLWYQFGIPSFPLLWDSLIWTKLQTSRYEKLPSHIGIVINEDLICFQKLGHVIIWCLALGVHHLSVYDTNGLVKHNGFKLYKNTMKYKEKYLRKNSSKFKVTFHNVECEALSNGTKNGHIYENELHVTLLSWEDGKRDIVQAARKACNNVKNNVLAISDINRAHFSKFLKALPQSPDPDLILCFGRGSSLIGYLPWQIHLSEIIFEKSHRYFQFSQLLDSLSKFNSCQQRFGK